MMKPKLISLGAAAAMVALVPTFTTGCAVVQKRETASAYAKDKEITARIKTALYADDDVKGTQVQVNTLNGEVQLSGFVDTTEERQRAESIANSVPGVRRVYNNLLLPTGR